MKRDETQLNEYDLRKILSDIGKGLIKDFIEKRKVELIDLAQSVQTLKTIH